MKLNQVSEPIFDSNDLFEEVYKGNLEIISDAKINYNTDIDYLSYVEFVNENNLNDWPIPQPYFDENRLPEEYDFILQNQWYIPEDYKNYDIETYLLSLCLTKVEKTRVEIEIELFKKHNMLSLLKFLKYLVETMRSNNILWGVGRGSSVSSYCLYLLGVHKIDSIKYKLNINEFLK